MGIGLGLCCCGGLDCPVSCAYVPFNDNHHLGMLLIYITGSTKTIGNDVPTAWDDAIDTILTPGMLLFTVDGLTWTRPAVADGFALELTFNATPIVPHAPDTWLHYKRMESLILSKDGDNITFVYDAESDRMIFDSENSTIDACFQFQANILLAARVLEDGATYINWQMDGEISGYGPGDHAVCTTFNRVYDFGTAGPSGLLIDGYLICSGGTGNIEGDHPFGGSDFMQSNVSMTPIGGPSTCDKTLRISSPTTLWGTYALNGTFEFLFNVRVCYFTPSGVGFPIGCFRTINFYVATNESRSFFDPITESELTKDASSCDGGGGTLDFFTEALS